jgi:hypothetical protein
VTTRKAAIGLNDAEQQRLQSALLTVDEVEIEVQLGGFVTERTLVIHKRLRDKFEARSTLKALYTDAGTSLREGASEML